MTPYFLLFSGHSRKSGPEITGKATEIRQSDSPKSKNVLSNNLYVVAISPSSLILYILSHNFPVMYKISPSPETDIPLRTSVPEGREAFGQSIEKSYSISQTPVSGSMTSRMSVYLKHENISKTKERPNHYCYTKLSKEEKNTFSIRTLFETHQTFARTFPFTNSSSFNFFAACPF